MLFNVRSIFLLGFIAWSLLFMHYVVSFLYSFGLILTRKGAFVALFYLPVVCSVALPPSVIGWFEVFNCGISISYSLTFSRLKL